MKDLGDTDNRAAMLAVIEEIVAGSRDLIRHWELLSQAEEALRRGGPRALARLYQQHIERPDSRTAWIKATLHAHGRKSFESEYQRFMALQREGQTVNADTAS